MLGRRVGRLDPAEQDLGRHPPQGVQWLVGVPALAEVDLGDRRGSVAMHGVGEQGEFDAVALHERDGLEQPPAACVLARQRLGEERELGPEEREQRARDQLGDPTTTAVARKHAATAGVMAAL